MLLSIIIPTLEEEENIQQLIAYLQQDPSFPLVQEIIVVDGNSMDRTREIAEKAGARVFGSKKNRAVQMNYGARKATGEILYFLHADTFPPVGFAQKIWIAVNKHYTHGCFRLRFDLHHWFLAANSWFTRFPSRYFRFGDQSLFVEKGVFELIGGFNEGMTLFEDQELVSRLSKHGRLRVLSNYIITSARKYRKNGPVKLQLVYFWIYLLYSLGFSQSTLLKTYRKMVPHPMM